MFYNETDINLTLAKMILQQILIYNSGKMSINSLFDFKISNTFDL
jgi:hypothetical protein